MGLTVPVVLGLAGVYELSPLKSACLRRCRNPAAFLMEHYRSGAVRLGVEHGIWCLGCCVGLMAVLVLAASMQLGWAIVIAGRGVRPEGSAVWRSVRSGDRGRSARDGGGRRADVKGEPWVTRGR